MDSRDKFIYEQNYTKLQRKSQQENAQVKELLMEKNVIKSCENEVFI